VVSVSLLLLVTILELVRRGRLREEYSLLLLLISSVILCLGIWGGVPAGVASFLGVTQEHTLLVGVTFVVTFIVQIVQGVIISSLSLHSRDLAQKVAELEWELAQVRNHARMVENEQGGETAAWVADLRETLAEEGKEELLL
jgi:hypothetical protein